MSSLNLCPGLFFHVGQRVMERWGDERETAQFCEGEIVSREGGTVWTDTGGSYDALTGAAEPKGTVYRSIRAIGVSEHKKAANLLGGTQARG